MSDSAIKMYMILSLESAAMNDLKILSTITLHERHKDSCLREAGHKGGHMSIMNKAETVLTKATYTVKFTGCHTTAAKVEFQPAAGRFRHRTRQLVADLVSTDNGK
jgi:hypothetical protein